MKMTYDETKNFISNQLLRNVYVDEKIDSSLFNDRELLIKIICRLCENKFNDEVVNSQVLKDCRNYNIKKLSTGWFSVDNEIINGRFINANAIFRKACCKKYECHQTSYNFMLENLLENMQQRSGTIEPYNNEKFLHSICTFTNNGKDYVFDGAKFLIMEKEAYFNLFKFNEIQSLTRRQIMMDRLKLAQEDIYPNGILKDKKLYRMATDYSNIAKRFSGMGFIIYLYNREAFMENQKPLKQLELENCKARDWLNEKIKEIKGENKIDNF